MITALRDYQQDLYLKAREALKKYRSICLQLHTGGGKTVIFTAMCESVYGKDKIAWIIVPRKELVRQASNHLRKWKVPHGIIDSKNQESKAYKIHVCSKSTLERRWDKIKNYPDLIIVDECHINFDFQKKLLDHIPQNTKIIGYTATPTRLDMRGLSKKSGGIYDILIEGPSIPWLTERNFLVPIRYFSPPLDGLDKIKVNRFGEYDSETLEELLQRKKVYGDLVNHWERWGKNRSTLIFCRSVKSAYHAAERFREKGYNFVAIDGLMPDNKINEILDKHRKGEIQGICNCLLVTFGVDIERIEYIGDISPTESLPTYCQKIGRGLRPFYDPETEYIKKDLIYMDHVNQLLIHQNENNPGIPLHYLNKIYWNFDGTERKKKNKIEIAPKLCPLAGFLYCAKPSCRNCEHNPDEQTPDPRKPMIVIPATLQELKKPVPLNERPPEERRELQDKIGKAIMDFKINKNKDALDILIKLQESLGYATLWIYWKLVDENRYTADIPLLHEIAKRKGYKPGWTHFAMKKIKHTKKINQEYQEVMNG